jgi:hypothetical protein
LFVTTARDTYWHGQDYLFGNFKKRYIYEFIELELSKGYSSCQNPPKQAQSVLKDCRKQTIKSSTLQFR